MLGSKYTYKIYTYAELEAGGDALNDPGDGQHILLLPEAVEMILSNPHHRPEYPAVACVLADGKRVAAAGLAPYPVRYRGHTFLYATDYNLWSDPDERGGGVTGLITFMYVRALKKAGMHFFSYGSSEELRNIYKSMGMGTIGLVPRFVIPLRTTAILDHYVPSRLAARGLSVPANFGLAATMRLLRWGLGRAGGQYRVERRDEFDVARLPTKLRDDPRPQVVRDETTMNWRLDYARGFSGVELPIFYVYGPGDEPIAYFVARIGRYATVGRQQFRNVKIFRVLELYTPEEARCARAVLSLVLAAARREECDVIEMVTTDSSVQSLCRKLRFPHSNGYPFYISNRKTAQGDVSPPTDRDSWYLSMIESELAFVNP